MDLSVWFIHRFGGWYCHKLWNCIYLNISLANQWRFIWSITSSPMWWPNAKRPHQCNEQTIFTMACNITSSPVWWANNFMMVCNREEAITLRKTRTSWIRMKAETTCFFSMMTSLVPDRDPGSKGEGTTQTTVEAFACHADEDVMLVMRTLCSWWDSNE